MTKINKEQKNYTHIYESDKVSAKDFVEFVDKQQVKTVKYLESPVFYMGCKYKLLKQIIPLFPKECDTFYDLFGGSGVVCMNYKGKKKTIYNDFNQNVADLLIMFRDNSVEELDDYFTKRIEEFNIVCTGKDFREHMELQKGYYDFRKHYNNSNPKDIRDLYLLSCYSMNHLMRFNTNNEFNASCGSTQRYIKDKIENGHNMLQGVEVWCCDSLSIDLSQITNKDFVYLDIPYLNTEAVYNEKRAFGGWNIDCDYKIFKMLEELNSRGIHWALSNVFENRGKTNDHLIEWCNKNNWTVHHLNRNYNPFSRGNSNNDEVLICNYEV